MNQLTQFRDAFEKLTGDQPFPWQEDLYTEWFSKGKFPLLCNLPTGLGKTSVVAIWLIALASWPEKMPRRLVYVVNRRTVLDQTTEEVLKYRQRIEELDENDLLKHNLESLAISTLRGQFADNREWSADPSRPAVIVGTVDMIGSRLLFSGYGVGFKAKPLHAYWTGSLHSREYQPREKLAHYPRWHVRLTFDQPRTGPLVIGAGRHCGFGLMAGADYSCRHYLRQMSIDQ